MSLLQPGRINTLLFSSPMLFRLISCCALLLLTLSCSHSVPGSDKVTEQQAAQQKQPPPENYQTANSCRNCHETIYSQFADSMHAKSYSNPVFNKTYFNILSRRMENDPTLQKEMDGCIACHAPMTFSKKGSRDRNLKQGEAGIAGVACDLCHTTTGYRGTQPGNGNYISAPSHQKLGPFQYKNDHHRAYSEQITKSEFCATCHNRTNRYGLEIISTFSEWKKSKYAKKGIQCQDCHMNSQGFLAGGKPVFDSGKAAQGTLIDPKKRNKLYSHRFPGAHSNSQIKDAISIDLTVANSSAYQGGALMIFVDIDNSKTGHKLPTGSAELRLLYLELTAEINGKTVHIPANSLNKDIFDVAGKGKFDSMILGKEIPDGSRLYRAVCVDPEGQQTLFSFDAEKKIFDNRLRPNEVRREFFTFPVPNIGGLKVPLTASLKYLRYPRGLADKLDIAEVQPIELAVVEKEIVLKPR